MNQQFSVVSHVRYDPELYLLTLLYLVNPDRIHIRSFPSVCKFCFVMSMSCHQILNVAAGVFAAKQALRRFL